VAISIAEVGSGFYLSAATSTIINGEYRGSVSLARAFVGVPDPSQYVPTHKLTIATDRTTFLELFVDDKLFYSSTSTLPINLSGNTIAMNFYQFASVNNETISTTWSNFTAYANSRVIVSGLASGQTVVVNGPNGFTSTALANSTGVAIIDVSAEPMNLTVSVESNGNTIATYNETVEAGASLKLAAQ
jgi:hypothetical protein